MLRKLRVVISTKYTRYKKSATVTSNSCFSPVASHVLQLRVHQMYSCFSPIADTSATISATFTGGGIMGGIDGGLGGGGGLLMAFTGMATKSADLAAA